MMDYYDKDAWHMMQMNGDWRGWSMHDDEWWYLMEDEWWFVNESCLPNFTGINGLYIIPMVLMMLLLLVMMIFGLWRHFYRNTTFDKLHFNTCHWNASHSRNVQLGTFEAIKHCQNSGPDGEAAWRKSNSSDNERHLNPRNMPSWLLMELAVIHIYHAGRIIATSHDLTPKGSWGREIHLFRGNLGWWNRQIPWTYIASVWHA